MWIEFINQVEETGLSFDEFFALYKVYSKEHKTRKIYYNSDMLSTYIELETKGFIKIIDNEALSFTLRESGKVFMDNFLKYNRNILDLQETHTPKQEIKQNKDDFEEFWKLFPSSDEHGIYRRTRILKANKEGCKKKYSQYIQEGVLHDDIIKALKYDVKLRRDGNNKQNNMMYMKNSLTWLNSKEFEVLLENIDDNQDNNSSEDWTSNLV